MNHKVGDIIGEYRLQALCGSGAYGTVYRAVNESAGQLVALKLVDLSSTGRKRRREIEGLKACCNLRHPNLVPILHIGEIDGCIYYTMPLADNATLDNGYTPDTLSERLRHGRIAAAAILDLATQLLDALEELHRRQLVHRDIKPDNILWINGRPALGDVGLVTPQADASFAGTPGFFRAEWLQGGATGEVRNDLYALAKVMYCALTGLPATSFPSLPKDLPLEADYSAVMRCCTTVCEADSPILNVNDFRRLLHQEPIRVPHRRSWKLWLTIPFLLLGWGVTRLYQYLTTPVQSQNHSEAILYTPEQKRALDRQMALEISVFTQLCETKGQEFFAANDIEAADFGERYQAFLLQLQRDELDTKPATRTVKLGQKIENLRAIVAARDTTPAEKAQAEAELKLRIPEWHQLLQQF